MQQHKPEPNPAKGAVIFASARTQKDSQRYLVAQALGRLLAEAGIPAITGGGGGSMLAVNRGALEAGGASVGIYMKLPREPQPNPYLNDLVTCASFFERKTEFFARAAAFVVLPGGLGTLDELSEAATHILTGRIPECPIILLETDFWRPLLDWFEKTLLKQGMIGDRALNVIRMVDKPEQAVELINRSQTP